MFCSTSLSEEIVHSTVYVYNHFSQQSSCIKTAQSLLNSKHTIGEANFFSREMDAVLSEEIGHPTGYRYLSEL